MGIYQRHVLPRLMDWAMGQALLHPYRERVVGGARGRVVELGVGSGRNLPFYGDAVDEVIGVDPGTEMLRLAEGAVATARPRVRLIAAPAEAVPLDDASADTVVVTFSLCTIPDPGRALAEARRLLRPGGEMRFLEHGWSPDPGVARWQDRLTPVWTRCAGGCHLNRRTDALIRDAGFAIAELRTGYGVGPRPMAYLYEGRALPA